MPDVHAGKVGPIGLTQTIEDTVLPCVVGIDVGCGMTIAEIKGNFKDFQKMDTIIREKIPSGFRLREKPHHNADNFGFDSLHCARHINLDKAMRSLGTLGGGNHFIESDIGSDGKQYLVVHSGSRHPGKEVTDYYLSAGQRQLNSQGIHLPYELTAITDTLLQEYLDDIRILQDYASLNREIMIVEICKGMKWKILNQYTCVHNYVEPASESYCGKPVLRKGAISAKEGEKLIIPINMRDGVILATGLGNEDWNMSAPHGSGRILKREDVASHYTVSDFKKEMKGIYSPSICKDTLDEAPFAYRTVREIAEVISETAAINDIIRPVYNYKSAL
ncbi:MAG: RtcB family protein [Lachnospiraceae bacterium]|nr:RtcB family protein [Lachnospiraceae bacterium]